MVKSAQVGLSHTSRRPTLLFCGFRTCTSCPAVVVTGRRGGDSVHLRRGNEVEDVEPVGEECGMRSLVLGAFIFASFGLTANAAEPRSDAKASTQGAPAKWSLPTAR